MQGDHAIISTLNALLTGELSAADQYLAHSRMLADWGFHRMAERIAHERVDELDHADRLIRRILFLDGAPDVASRTPLAIGADVPEMLANDLAYEMKVAADLRASIRLCEEKRDFESREVLVFLLEETENDHIYWLEQQIGLLKTLGRENYLQSMLGKDRSPIG